MLEKELKALLTEKQYNDIDDRFDWESSFTQINYYYDTRDFRLYKQDITCRVREIEGKYTLQIKYPNISTDDRILIREEKSHVLTDLPKNFIFEDGKSKESFEVYKLGFLKTLRKVLKISDETSLFIDKNWYFDIVDYELEIEYVNGTDKAEMIMREMNMVIRIIKGKYTRFINEFINRLPI